MLSRISVDWGQDWFGFGNTRLIQLGSFRNTWGGRGEVGERLLSRVGEVDRRFGSDGVDYSVLRVNFGRF